MAPRQLNDVDNARNDVLKVFGNDGEDNLGDEEVIIPSNDPEDDADDDLTKEDENDDIDAGDDDANSDDADDEIIPPQQQPQRATTPVAAEDKNEKLFRFQQDRAGNLVDKDGNILVKAGKQRDLFTKMKKAWQTERDGRSSMNNQFQEVVAAGRLVLQRYNTLKAEKSIPESLGLTASETKEASEMMAMMKIDPKGALRNLLTKMHLAGTDLKDIGVNGPLDAKEVAKHMLDMQEASKPKPKSDEELAQEEVKGFLGRHPDAKGYAGVLAEAKRRFPVLSYDQLWVELIRTAERKQVATTPVARDGKKPNTPIPHNGRRPAPQIANPNGKLSLKAVDPSQSFSQIGSQLLRDIKALEGK